MQRLTGFVEELRCSHQLPPSAVQGSMTYLRSALDSIDIVALRGEDKATLKSLGCSLWNFTSSQKPGELRAAMRGAACDLFYLGSDIPTFTTAKPLLELVKMFTKTGRDFSDVGNHGEAAVWLRRAADQAKALPDPKTLRSDPALSDKVHAVLADLHTVALTALTKAQDGDGMVRYLMEGGPLLQGLAAQYAPRLAGVVVEAVNTTTMPPEISVRVLGQLCYLLRSFEATPDDEAFWHAVSHSCLLLARVQMTLQQPNEALGSLTTALQARPTPQCHAALVQALLALGQWEKANEQLLALVVHPKATFSHILGASQMMIEAGQVEFAVSSLLSLLSSKSADDIDAPRAYLQVIQLLLSRCDYARAYPLMDEAATRYAPSSLLPSDIRDRLFYLSWDAATKGTSEGRLRDGLQWLNLSLRLSNGANEHDKAKVLRAVARVYHQLCDLDNAAAAVMDSLHIEPLSLHGNFILLQISVDQGNTHTAEKALLNLGNGEPQHLAPHIFALSAQYCHGKGMMSLCCTALEKLLGYPITEGSLLRKRFILLRNFVLCLESLGGDTTTKVHRALELFVESVELQMKGSSGGLPVAAEELTWWHAKAHNNAVKAAETRDYQKAIEAFASATRLVQLMPSSPGSTGLLIHSFLGEMHCAQRDSTHLTSSYAKGALLRLSECKLLFHRYQHADPKGLPQRLFIALSMAEVMCSVASGAAEAEILTMLQQLRGSGEATAEDMESCAGILSTVATGDKYRNALRFAVQGAIHACGDDARRRVKLYRVLLEGCPTREEQLDIFLRVKAEVFGNDPTATSLSLPPEETRWMIAESWNAGTQVWHLNHKQKAERFLSLACDMAMHLPNHDPLYAQLLPQYQAVLQSIKMGHPVMGY